MKVGFVDFWPGFNPLDLFFVPRLIQDNFIEIEKDLNQCKLLFCGVFNSYRPEGQESLKYPKAHRFLVASESFVNHPTFPKKTFKYGVCGDKNVLGFYHLPYAAYEFNLPNDIGTLVDKYSTSTEPIIAKVIKTNFCGFCASNGEQFFKGVRFRDAFFKLLCGYKHVDSFGSHLNNMPDGERAPRSGYSKYLSTYKFMICFENEQGPGYITEKPVQCFVSQTIPIYWGESSGMLNPDACVIVDPDNMHAAIQRILYLDSHPDAYAQMLEAGQTKPFLDLKPFNRDACYDYVKTIVQEIKSPLPPPVVIISLKRRAGERRDAVLKECARVGLTNVNIFEAIDGASVDQGALKTSLAAVLNPNTVLTPGQLGCFASHVAVWRSVKAGWTIVLEDDCRFHPDFDADAMLDLIKSIPPGAMMLRLAYLAAGAYANHVSPVVDKWHPLIGPVFSLVAYAVHSSVIPFLLSYVRQAPIDCQLPWGSSCYGAPSLSNTNHFYDYANPVLKTHESFFGIASVLPYESDTQLKNRIHTFGDSHAQFGFNSITGVLPHNIGPKLAYSFGKHGLNVLNLKNFAEVCEGDIVIFAFGEIDCRCHIKKRCVDDNYHSAIDSIVETYAASIDANVRQFASLKTCILSITPAVRKNENAENAEYPFLGTDDERKAYVAYFNQALSKICLQHNYTFIDVHNAYADPEGFLQKDLSDGNVHIQNPVHIITALHSLLQ